MTPFVGERDVLILNTVPRYSAPIDRALMLTPSATMFEVSVAGEPTPAAITFSALMLGAVGEITFSSEPPVPLTVANGDAVLKFVDMTASIVTVSATTIIDGLTYYARQTVAKTQALDLRPPPAPTGLVVSGKPATIVLTWDAASGNYNNLSHTEVWCASVNNFAQATLVGRADGREFTDPVGPGVSRYYWIRYVSRAAIPGPYNASSGTVGASDVEVEHLLGVLTEQITLSQLHADLGAKIELIDDLEAAYGDTASAAASAAAAALARAAAEQAAGHAGQYKTAAIEASTRAQTDAAAAGVRAAESAQAATNADGAAAAANNSASIAAQAANTAGNSAQAAVISGQNASTAASQADGSAQAAASFLQQAQAILIDPVTGLVDKYAAVKVLADATANSLGKVQAKYGVQVDADGVSGGFELIGGGGRVDFGARASTFFIAAPAGSGVPSAVPFIVRTTEAVIGGVTIPIGVYIANAFIQNASITNAKIGGDIWSSNYAAGVAGWRLNRAGNMEVNNLYARGEIAGGAFRSADWPAAGLSGFYLGQNGLMLGNTNNNKYFWVTSGGDIYAPGFSIVNGIAIFSGALGAASGTFAGELMAASGTFGIIRAGRLQNANNTAYVNLDAVGAVPFLYAGAGAIKLNADGSGYFARSIISAPNVVITGVTSIAPGAVGWISGAYRPFTVYIDTGKTFEDPWNSAASATFLANATISNGTSLDGGCNGYGESTVVVGDGLGNPGISPIDNRIYIRFTWTPVSGTGSITPTALTWKLVQV